MASDSTICPSVPGKMLPCAGRGAEINRIGGLESQTLELRAMVGARHLIPAGFDSAPLYRGLPDDMCPASTGATWPKGRLRYRFADGEELTIQAGEAFHVRAGHLAEVQEDAELIEFTPTEQYRRKATHLARRPEQEADA